MNRKYVTAVIILGVFSFVIGLIGSQFIQIPAFKAEEELPAGFTEIGPLYGSTKPDPKTLDGAKVMEVGPEYAKSQPFTCPSGYLGDSELTYPFYLTRKVSKLINTGKVVREPVEARLDPGRGINVRVGYNLYYEALTAEGGSKIVARLKKAELVKVIDKKLSWYKFNASAEFPWEAPELTGLLAAPLIATNFTLPKSIPTILLCTKVGGSGSGGGTGGGS